MAQNTAVLLSDIRYTRADFTALRAYLSRLPLQQISSLYYNEDDLLALGCTSDRDLKQRLEDMRDRLMLRAGEANPHLVALLDNARKTAVWSAKLTEFLVQGADADLGRPKRQDALSAWFRPRLANALKGEGVATLADLLALIAGRGEGWWKPIPLIGPGKAARIEAWLAGQAATLGPLAKAPAPTPRRDIVLLAPDQLLLVPLERVALPQSLDGSDGINRQAGFRLINARHDLEALGAYLVKYRLQEPTRRAYQRELERFLLWCVYQRRLPLSSVMHEDSEAYKDFLAALPAQWCSTKRWPRFSNQWRPFAGELSPGSQRYAIQALRQFFAWLVDVRYLAGNPWVTVGDPPVAKPLHRMQIGKALPEALWDKLTQAGGILDRYAAADDAVLAKRFRLRGSAAKMAMSAQFRLVRAALLLLGDCGLRREELAAATRDKLRPGTAGSGLWELDVLGKRNKWRTVFPSPRTIAALAAHWQDRGLDFSYGLIGTPLLAPLWIPPTNRAATKHRSTSGKSTELGFGNDGIYALVTKALRRIAADEDLELDIEERACLARTAPHALRHTFGTHAVARGVDLDVVQGVLGHASLETTSIYVQAEKRRKMEQLATRMFGKQ